MATRPRSPAYLIPHPVIRKISFTGSTVVGKQLAALAGQHMKRVTMELGGHAPVIVAEDADLELAVKSSGAAKFRNAGQVCISPTRFLVHESIRNDFAAALARHAQSLKVGDGLAEGTQMGPLANPRRIVAMADARRRGPARARRWPPAARASARPATSSPHGAHRRAAGRPVFNDEPFGPVAAIRGFNTSTKPSPRPTACPTASPPTPSPAR
jgi:succinate-semialdehyde dehydrogenase/glutarate-semialdehyde dehydrogenase